MTKKFRLPLFASPVRAGVNVNVRRGATSAWSSAAHPDRQQEEQEQGFQHKDGSADLVRGNMRVRVSEKIVSSSDTNPSADMDAGRLAEGSMSEDERNPPKRRRLTLFEPTPLGVYEASKSQSGK